MPMQYSVFACICLFKYTKKKQEVESTAASLHRTTATRRIHPLSLSVDHNSCVNHTSAASSLKSHLLCCLRTISSELIICSGFVFFLLPCLFSVGLFFFAEDPFHRGESRPRARPPSSRVHSTRAWASDLMQWIWAEERRGEGWFLAVGKTNLLLLPLPNASIPHNPIRCSDTRPSSAELRPTLNGALSGSFSHPSVSCHHLRD